MEIEKETVFELSINRKSDIFASSSYKEDHKSPKARIQTEVSITPFEAGVGPDTTVNHQQHNPISSSALIIKPEQCHDEVKHVTAEDLGAHGLESNLWDVIDKSGAFKKYKSSLYKFKTNLLASQAYQLQKAIMTCINRPSQLTIKKDILRFRTTCTGSIKEQFTASLQKHSTVSSLLTDFIQRQYHCPVKIFEDFANRRLEVFLITPASNLIICEYSGKITAMSKEAIAIVIFSRLSTLFHAWIKQHFSLKHIMEAAAIDIDMMFITDEIADMPNLVSVDANHQLTPTELEEIIKETVNTNEEIRFHPKFTLKVFDLPPTVLSPNKTIEENIHALFQDHFKMKVHFIFESSKQLSRIRFCEGKNPLITYQVAKSADMGQLKEKVCKSILKFIIKNDAFEYGCFGQNNTSPQKVQEVIRVSYMNHTSPISLVSEGQTTNYTSSAANQDKAKSLASDIVQPKPSKSRSKSKCKSLPQRNTPLASGLLDSKAKLTLTKMMCHPKNISLGSFAEINEYLQKLSTIDLTSISFHAIEQQKAALIPKHEFHFLFALLLKITLNKKFSENRVQNVEFFCVKDKEMFTFKASYRLYPFTETQSILVESESEQQTTFEGRLALLRAFYRKCKSIGTIVKSMLEVVKRERIRSDKNPFSIGYKKPQSQQPVVEALSEALRATLEHQNEIAKYRATLLEAKHNTCTR